MPAQRLRFHPLTAERWPDLEKLFGQRGACGGCWCMFWRLMRPQYEKQKGNGNKRAFKKLVASGEVPGVLAYLAHEPIGWCAFSRREKYLRLANSRILQPVDEQPVWSVTCLFIKKEYRRQGISTALLRAAAQHAKQQGAKIIEGYPVDPKKGPMADTFVWTGLASAFLHAGFKEVLRRSETRPIMRFYL